MKKILAILAVFTVLFTSCLQSENKQSSYQTEWSTDKKDSVVHVNYYNNSTGQFLQYYLLYHIFFSNFSSGGYPAVHNYYTSHPNSLTNPTYYSNYKPSIEANKQNGAYSSPSSPSRSSYFNSSSSKNYTSPSYSSPSRSSSSSGSSYTSPSRSYSSPSRSYSSPSRR